MRVTMGIPAKSVAVVRWPQFRWAKKNSEIKKRQDWGKKGIGGGQEW